MPDTFISWSTRCLLVITLSLAQTVTSQADFSIPSTYTQWDNANWILTTNKLIQGQYQSRAPIANGQVNSYIGCAVAAAGPFFEADVNFTVLNGGSLPINGWPLDNPRQTFCTVSGFFNAQANTTRTNFPENLARGAESVIAGIPNWPNLLLQVGDAVLDATVDNTTISNFTSSRSLKTGLLSWSYTWSPLSQASVDIAYDMIIDRSSPNVAAIRLVATPSTTINATVIDLLDGRGSVRSDPGDKGFVNGTNTIYSSVSPHWVGNVSAWIFSTIQSRSITNDSRANASALFYSYSNSSTIAQQFPVVLSAGQAVTITKYVGIASSDGFDDPRQTASDASTNAAQFSFDDLLTRSAAAWAEILDEDLVDDYALPDGTLPDDPNIESIQIISKANSHYLLQNLLSNNLTNLAKWSISVGGLTSDSYAGMIFWDADTFMSPGVSISHPEYASQISNYRVQLSGQAAANAVNYSYSEGSMLFPWTSGRFGNCTGTGPCVDYQYHLNNDIFLNNLLYWRITGDDQWFRDSAIPINSAVLQMYSELVYYNSTQAGYSIRNLTDPDEYANQVPNGAYTLASIAKDIQLAQQYASQFNLTLPDNYSAIANDMALPFAPSGVLAEYLGANNTAVIKQDDVDLINYPLDYGSENYTQADRLTSLDYYSNLQSPDGPAMTYSLYSISANSLSPSGCPAYTYSLAGFEPYARAPWYQFSEQQVDDFATNGGTNPAFPFMTGAGGWHQIGPMGWLGVRATEAQLIIQPSLPPQIPYVSLRTIIFAGVGLKATMNNTHTNITRVDVSRFLPSNATQRYPASSPFPFTQGFELATGQNLSITLNQTLTLANRVYSTNLTAQGNLLQCQPATSPDATAPGQFPLAAVDGSASTRWQPASLAPTLMTVDTRGVPRQPLAGIGFDWGARPPTSARVVLYNTTSSTDASALVTLVSIPNVPISAPYDASNAAEIRPYTGNVSFYAFDATQSVYSADFFSLAVSGCDACGDDKNAATVGEVMLFAVGQDTLLSAAQAGRVSNGAVDARAVTVGSAGVSAVTGVPGQLVVSGLGTVAASTGHGNVVGSALGQGGVLLVALAVALVGLIF